MNDEPIATADAPLASARLARPLRWWIPALVLVLALYLASPYYAFWRFTVALRAGDAAQIERSVDFPSLRKSMRKQLNASIAALRPQNPKRQKMFDTLSDALGSRVIDSLLDAHLTPEGLAAFLANPKLPGSAAQQPPASDAPLDNAAPAAKAPVIAPETNASAQTIGLRIDWSKVRYAFFTGPFDFLVDVEGTKLRFHFTGVRWRLREVELDVSKLKI